jgi:cellulose synthase/poly-beta-1,6-N-acetylglucosamine synthase-like glycosyltransferase
MMTIFYLISGILIFFLVFPFFTVILSLFTKDKMLDKLHHKQAKDYDFANIITAYRNADIAKPLVQSLLMQTHGKHHIYLVADNANVDSWDILHKNLTVLRPEEALNLKVKSIIHATENYVRKHDYAVIWDADNLAHPHFLETINAYANAGHKAIQGQRTAKNLDTLMAAADSLGEFYKNYIERFVPPRLGSSTVISGSGMAVEQELYDTYLYGEEITQGKKLWKKMLQEDKILQNHLVREGERIVYAQDAICYDEKVTSANEVETQRSRWLFSYFQNVPNSTGFILRGLVSLNWNKFFFGLITASLPLFILLGLSGLMCLLGLLIDVKTSLILASSIAVFMGNIFFCLYLSKVPPMVWKAVFAIPTFVMKQFSALFKMANPNKNFKHSEHKVVVSIDDLLHKN